MSLNEKGSRPEPHHTDPADSSHRSSAEIPTSFESTLDPTSRDTGSLNSSMEKTPVVAAEDLDQEPTMDAENDIEPAESRASLASRRSKASQAIMEKVASRSSKKSQAAAVDAVAPTVLPLSNLDDDIVGWDSQDDPTMPLNFTPRKKNLTVALLAILTLMSPLSSSIIAPAINIFSAEFGNTNTTLAAMPVSIFLLGFAVGPLFLAPMCEIHGRAVVLISSNAFFCLWQIGCALAPSLGSLIVFRFLAGIGGSAPLTLGGGVIADLFPVAERGFAIAMWTIGPTIGPSIAPIMGAFIAGSIGWRWAVWIVFIPATLATVLMLFFFPETNHGVLMKRKVRRLRKELGRPGLRSCYETEESRSLTSGAVLRRGLIRPLNMLFLSPVITVLSLYISFVYGTIYLMYNTVSTVFQSVYGWSTGVSGLAFIALGLGYVVGLTIFSLSSDRHVVRLTRANGGQYEPEMRLPTMVYFAVVCPVTFFWYGWAAESHAPWPATVVGLFPLGVGIFGIWMPAQAYLIDAYPQYAASALAAFTVLRSITAAFLPLAGPNLFKTLGLGWGNSVLGFICVAMIPVPVLIHRYGGYVRKRWPVKL